MGPVPCPYAFPFRWHRTMARVDQDARLDAHAERCRNDLADRREERAREKSRYDERAMMAAGSAALLRALTGAA